MSVSETARLSLDCMKWETLVFLAQMLGVVLYSLRNGHQYPRR